MLTNILSGRIYLDLISGGAANLRANSQKVNDLNVFPIPDGDTGDNMSSTAEGASRSVNDNITLGDAAKCVSDGMLLGARGNSGVILSQFFAGIADALKNADTANANEFAKACISGTARAYEAVAVPTEGTILTVMREASDYAASQSPDNFKEFFDAFISEAKRSLSRTPQLLAVLAKAGVVDSGGAGFIYIFEGMQAASEGKAPESIMESPSLKKTVDISGFTSDSVLEFGYCTEFLLRLQNSKVNTDAFDISVITDYLSTIGNSVVAIKDGTVVKAHVHTENPGDVLNFCRRFGEFLTVKIENMSLQHSEAESSENEEAKPAKERTRLALVSVSNGDGIADMFTELGADRIINGGQSMNPSSQDFIDAFDDANADIIVVLPNNSNVILAAKQAAEIYDKSDVRVLETKTIGDGYAAIELLAKDAEDIDAMISDMSGAFGSVVTGMISRAVRDANMDGIDVKSGDYIGFAGKEILTASANKVGAACDLAEHLGIDEHDILIVIRGSGATEDESAEVAARLRDTYKNKEIYELNGQQDIYDFIIIAE